jgi:mycinamicin biosynthesis methyltransferase MycE-like protein
MHVLDVESWNGADELSSAVGGRDEQVSQVIAAIGPDRVAAMLAAEIRERAEVPHGIGNASANLVIRHHAGTYRYAISFKGAHACVAEGEAADAVAEVTYSLLDLTRLLYPHRAGYRSTSRDVRVLRWPWDQQEGSSFTPEQPDEMVRRGEADPEQLWQHFFPRGLIYGMDLYAKPGVRGPRIRTIQGDQNNIAFLSALGESLGPFDIIIDDGSHLNEHVSTSGEAPPGSSRTSIGMLKGMLDSLNVSEYAGDQLDRTQLTHPSEVHAYHDIVFLRKGINHERGIPGWIKQASTQAGSFGSSSLGDRASERGGQ